MHLLSWNKWASYFDLNNINRESQNMASSGLQEKMTLHLDQVHLSY